MRNKYWINQLLLSTFGFLLVIILINFFVDPFQHYRISSWYEITSKKQRHVTPGLAKNSMYTTALIGSSMAENFQASFINKELNTTSLKLCMAGMTAHEMNKLLTIVTTNNPHLKEVIISLDLYALSGNPTRVRNEKLPLYLFDNKKINDIFYLLNKQTLDYSIKVLRKSLNRTTDYDRMWYWGNSVSFGKKIVLSSYKHDKFNTDFINDDYKYPVLKNSFDLNILPIIRNNPDVKFTIFFPPYSYLTYKDMQSKHWLNETFTLKHYLVNLKINSLDIYDFQCVSTITENLDNYKDISHYSPQINQYMILSLKKNNHILNAFNINQCVSTIQKSANKDIFLSTAKKGNN